MKVIHNLCKTLKYVSTGMLIILIAFITGCGDDGQVGPRPTGQFTLETPGGIESFTIDKAFIRNYFFGVNATFEYSDISLFSEGITVSVFNDSLEASGVGSYIITKRIIARAITINQNCSATYGEPDQIDEPDYQFTSVPHGRVYPGFKSVGVNKGISASLEKDLIAYDVSRDDFCFRETDQISIQKSDLNENWHRIEFNYSFLQPGSNEDYGLLKGYYEGPLTVITDISNGPPTTVTPGAVETISGVRSEGDADGIPGALSYGDLDLYLSRFTSSIFISDFGNDKVKTFDETNGLTTVSQSFVGPASIVALTVEAFEELYVAETRDKQLRRVIPETGFTESVLIQDPDGNMLEGDATWYESLAVNQDPSLPQRTIYALTASSGNLAYSNRIMKVDVRGNRATQTLYAGSFSSNPSEVINGPSDIATFNFAEDIALDYQNNLYVAAGHSIRKIDSETGLVSTLAGLDENGNYLGMPSGYEFDKVFDADGNRINRGFNSVAYDAFNDRIIATHLDNEIWAFSEVNGQLQSELIKDAGFGSEDGSLVAARFRRPNNVQVDPENGDIYLADGPTIRRIRAE